MGLKHLLNNKGNTTVNSKFIHLFKNSLTNMELSRGKSKTPG